MATKTKRTPGRNATQERYRDYDPFAWLYAHYWGTEYHEQALAVLERLILRLLPEHARILDLCCGDGRIARELVDRGYRVTGFDGSREILAIARQRVPEAKFVLGDARELRVKGPFDAAISTFDSLNHVMSTAGLRAVFEGVHRALGPGGYFAFDLNRERAYTDSWVDEVTTLADDVVSIARSGYDPKTALAECNIVLMRRAEKNGGNLWERSDFTLTQRCHPHNQVLTALVKAGFVNVASFDAASDLSMSGGIGRHRTFYLARK